MKNLIISGCLTKKIQLKWCLCGLLYCGPSKKWRFVCLLKFYVPAQMKILRISGCLTKKIQSKWCLCWRLLYCFSGLQVDPVTWNIFMAFMFLRRWRKRKRCFRHGRRLRCFFVEYYCAFYVPPKTNKEKKLCFSDAFIVSPAYTWPPAPLLALFQPI